jgi:hypothetical protein
VIRADVNRQGWLRRDVLLDLMRNTDEAIARNQAMFRRDEEKADNVLQVQLMTGCCILTHA